jgi:hypothetical protein
VPAAADRIAGLGPAGPIQLRSQGQIDHARGRRSRSAWHPVTTQTTQIVSPQTTDAKPASRQLRNSGREAPQQQMRTMKKIANLRAGTCQRRAASGLR